MYKPRWLLACGGGGIGTGVAGAAATGIGVAGWATVAGRGAGIGAVAGIGVDEAIGVVAGNGVATGKVVAIGGADGTGVRGALGLSRVGEASQNPAGRSVLPPVGPATGVRGTVGATAEDAGTVVKALANASAVWKRFAASLAIAMRMISFNAAGSPGFSSRGGLGAWLRCAAMIEYSLLARKGLRPVTNS
jgi:hypothetical protein